MLSPSSQPHLFFTPCILLIDKGDRFSFAFDKKGYFLYATCAAVAREWVNAIRDVAGLEQLPEEVVEALGSGGVISPRKKSADAFANVTVHRHYFRPYVPLAEGEDAVPEESREYALAAPGLSAEFSSGLKDSTDVDAMLVHEDEAEDVFVPGGESSSDAPEGGAQGLLYSTVVAASSDSTAAAPRRQNSGRKLPQPGAGGRKLPSAPGKSQATLPAAQDGSKSAPQGSTAPSSSSGVDSAKDMRPTSWLLDARDRLKKPSGPAGMTESSKAHIPRFHAFKVIAFSFLFSLRTKWGKGKEKGSGGS